MFGVEACLRCGRRAFFVDYSHWMPPHPSTYQTGYREADSFAGGLRFQTQGRVRPFFDVGGVVASAGTPDPLGPRTEASSAGW
jgi:hypothetical protein